MLKKLRVKLVCINMIIVTAMLLVIFSLVLYFTRQDLANQSLNILQSIVSDPKGPGHPNDLPQQIHTPYFTLQQNNRGELLVNGDIDLDLTNTALLTDLYQTVQTSEQETGLLSNLGLRYLRVSSPMGQFVVFIDATYEMDTMKGLFQTSLLIGALSFLLFLGLSILLSRWAVKPVATAWAQQRQFVADASHELKTPLTVITTNAELLCSPDCTGDQQEQFSFAILTMARQMRGLVEKLLDQARVDTGTVRASFTRLNLSELVQEAVLPFDGVFFEAELTLTTDIESGISLRGSAAHLRQVVEILLDNARKYASCRTAVNLQLRRTGRGSCLLTVSNAGAPISPQDLKKIFQRFYRVDQARAMNQSYGLGLSIAEGIVDDHGGRIWAESSGGQNTFLVQLPTL